MMKSAHIAQTRAQDEFALVEDESVSGARDVHRDGTRGMLRIDRVQVAPDEGVVACGEARSELRLACARLSGKATRIERRSGCRRRVE